MPKEEQESWIEDTVSEREIHVESSPRLCPTPAPRGTLGEGAPLKRTQDAAITEAFDNAANEILDASGGAARDKRFGEDEFY